MRRTIAVGAALILAGAVAGVPHFGSAQSAASWPTFHADQTRDGISSVTGTTSTSALNEFSIAPSVLSSVPSSPAVDASGTAYIGADNGTVYALSPAHASAPKWTFDTGARVESSPSLSPDGTKVFVGSDNGNLYALAASTGKQLWVTNLGSQVRASPLVSSDGATLYIPSVDGVLYGINTSDGSTKFTFNPGQGSMPTSVAASPDGGTLYVVVGDQMYGVPASGPTATSNNTAFYLDGNGTTTPSVDANGNIYVGTDRGQLDSFTPTSTTPRWVFTVPGGAAITSTPAFVNGYAVFGAGSKYIYAVNESTGQQVWQSLTGGAINSSPAVASGNNTIYIGSSDGTLYGLSQSGTVLFHRSFGSAIDSSPALAPDGTLWVSTRGGTVFRLGATAAPPTPPVPPTGTITPPATSTPVATSVATTVPTATVIPTALTIKLKAKVKPGSRQKITITSTANTVVAIRVNYPNGDHQSHSVTTSALGTAVYSYVQGSSKVTYHGHTATVIATTGTQTATATYSIPFGRIDVSLQPRSLKAGHVVDIVIHTNRYTRVVAYLLFPRSHLVTKYGRTGKKGFASIKYKVPKGLVTSTKRKVIVTGKWRYHKNYSSKSFFTVAK